MWRESNVMTIVFDDLSKGKLDPYLELTE